MKTLETFRTENLDKSEMFNTLSKSILGGASTTCGGLSTHTTGVDGDTATSDEDQDPAPVKDIFF